MDGGGGLLELEQACYGVRQPLQGGRRGELERDARVKWRVHKLDTQRPSQKAERQGNEEERGTEDG